VDNLKIKLFLKECGYVASEEELVAIIRRVDLDGDDLISLWEFKELLPPEYSTGSLITQPAAALEAPRDC
jgi:Ca2+-binding EF-hand superfamily protein